MYQTDVGSATRPVTSSPTGGAGPDRPPTKAGALTVTTRSPPSNGSYADVHRRPKAE